MRHYIDTNYTVSEEPMQRHRALAIIKPMKNMTGEYSCSVGSLKNDDKRRKFMQMIVPESDLELRITEIDDEPSIECIAKNVFPSPKLTILCVHFLFCLLKTW